MNQFMYEDLFEECTLIDRRTVPDGMGGFVKEWVDGATFQAAVTKDDSLEARVAEKQGVTEVYTVTVNQGIDLDFHDVFRRSSDGLIYRITSNTKDMQSPPRATFKIATARAERWELPDD